MLIKVPFITKNGEVLTTKNYEEYYVEETIGIECNFYCNRADKKMVDKTDFMVLVSTENIILKQETSIINPVITLERTTFPNFNYVYIKELKRYYFVTNIDTIRYGLWEISLSVDVLMSYKDALLNLNAFVDRNANVTNPMLIDKKRVIEQGVNVEIAEIENDVFFKDNELFQPDTDLMFVINGYKIESADTLAQ